MSYLDNGPTHIRRSNRYIAKDGSMSYPEN